MNAKDVALRDLLERRIQLQIPIYQRTYDWGEKNCRQLYDDIVNAGRMGKTHFIGAITHSGKKEQPVDVPCYQIIDGQQRITSIMLLMRALKDSDGIPDGLDSRIDHLLFNVGEDKSGPDYHKLVLTEEDYGTFKGIMEYGKTDAAGNMAACFNQFREWLDRDHSANLIWKGVQGLTAVSILLGESDDAQAIFESMNSTGLDLSPTDLIQNYLLMDGKPEWQRVIYEKYWKPMESQFREQSVDPDKFFWCYLSMRHRRAVSKRAVYKSFKEYMINRDRDEEIMEISRHFEQYVKLFNTSLVPEHRLRGDVEYACDQGTDVANPLLLKVLADRAAGTVSDDDTRQILVLVGSYLLRSRVCGTLTGANKRFPEFVGRIEKGRYAESVMEALMSKRGGGRFPRDDEFKEELKRIPLYTNAVCKYVLTRLNGNHREMAEPDKLNIEHIMPQNLDERWKSNLGDNHEEVHERYLHTIGNLTLTAYNSELGNMQFSAKRKIYNDSMIAMTRDLASFGRWGEKEIRERSRRLAEQAVRIWAYPSGYDSPGTPERVEQEYGQVLEEEYLDGRNTAELWNALKREIRLACPGILFSMTKHYGTFRLPAEGDDGGAGICSMESLRNSVHVTYNTKIDEGIVKPSDFVRDVSKVGHYATGDLRTTIASTNDAAKVVRLVRYVWDAKSGSRSA